MINGPAVLVEGLGKTYPGGVRAVDGISFAVERGEFFGFLGPNGAGKTTTIKILATLLPKTEGRVEVAGLDVIREPKAVRQAIGVALQEVGLDDLSKGRDFLELQGVLYGLSRAEARTRATELLELVGLSSVADRKVGSYSGGMRRRIDLAGALMHNPGVLFLDEPTTGLDPQSRITVWEHLEELNARGVTIFLTTQHMDEADRLCRRLAMIDHGRLVAEGSPAELKAGVGGDIVHVAFDAGESPDEGVAAALAAVRTLPGVRQADIDDNGLIATVGDGGAAAPAIMAAFQDAGLSIANLSITRPSLDDVFLQHTGRQIRDSDADGDAEDRMWSQWMGVNRR
ncbi:MAG: ATP-binding cassette domain-containing protein [Chloroflexota bacterium]|nr:ATP-binding cassette domain-containing protein [Chloroflexota bacterium]